MGSHSDSPGPASLDSHGWLCPIRCLSVGLFSGGAAMLAGRKQSQAPSSPQKGAVGKVLRTLSKSGWAVEGNKAALCLHAAIQRTQTIPLRDSEPRVPGRCGKGETLGIRVFSETLQSAWALVYEWPGTTGSQPGIPAPVPCKS